MTLKLTPLALAMLILGGLVPIGGCTSADSRPAPLTIAATYAVDPSILALQIETGQITYARQMPYQPKLGEFISQKNSLEEAWVKTPLSTVGVLIGKDQKQIYTFDQIQGERLDTGWANQPKSYQIQSAPGSNPDPNYVQGKTPIGVFRKSKPTDMAQTDIWKFDFPIRHTLYLKLAQPLKPGQTYDIKFPGSSIAAVKFAYKPDRAPSEAVHVSHIGFRPDDPAKVAFLSTWMGDGGALNYGPGLNFTVVDQANQKPVWTGKTQLSKAADQPEDGRNRNYSKTPVYAMEFSGLKASGNYRVCVDRIGCSVAFPIGGGPGAKRANPWQQAFYTSARGLYHQRSGIALKAPYTSFERPRPFHSADGTVVHQAKVSLMDVDQGLGSTEFAKALQASGTDQVVPNAWGGYFDAGDWDRRVSHVVVASRLIELTTLFPDYFEKAGLNLPESGNGLPDTINEALWGLDLYRRLQVQGGADDGGIRGGIQSVRDPKRGEGSWQESLPVMAYAPDPWSSYLYVVGAAQMAHWLETRQPKLAQQYRDSALRAMGYADGQGPTGGHRHLSRLQNHPMERRDSRNLAALALYQLTGEARWHDIFRQTTVFVDPSQETYVWKDHEQRDAAFLYLQLPLGQTDLKLRENVRQALIREADVALGLTQTTGFKWSKKHPQEPIGWGGLGAPNSLALLRAHAVTQDDKYLKAALLSTQFALGANPENMTYTTGLGQRSPQHPLLIDQRVLGRTPPPGITVYGPIDSVEYADLWSTKWLKDTKAVYPPIGDWPTTESYFDLLLVPATAEFTVMQTIAPSAYTWGYLAARRSK
jgi:endoglucanase